MKIETITPEVLYNIGVSFSEYDSMIYGLTTKEKRINPKIVNAQEEITETVETLVESIIQFNTYKKTAIIQDEFEKKALFASHYLFDCCCERELVHKNMMEDPNAFIDYLVCNTEDDVNKVANAVKEYCDKLMIVAKKLWQVSFEGIDAI